MGKQTTRPHAKYVSSGIHYPPSSLPFPAPPLAPSLDLVLSPALLRPWATVLVLVLVPVRVRV